jgi:hypothetical protein
MQNLKYDKVVCLTTWSIFDIEIFFYGPYGMVAYQAPATKLTLGKLCEFLGS